MFKGNVDAWWPQPGGWPNGGHHGGHNHQPGGQPCEPCRPCSPFREGLFVLEKRDEKCLWKSDVKNIFLICMKTCFDFYLIFVLSTA